MRTPNQIAVPELVEPPLRTRSQTATLTRPLSAKPGEPHRCTFFPAERTQQPVDSIQPA